LRRECRKTTIINGRVGEEKPRSKAPILSDRSRPDDNPAETIFSDIQQNILDNSDDPDERATKGRISNHLRARNRRPDRFIHIRYLEDTHKS